LRITYKNQRRRKVKKRHKFILALAVMVAFVALSVSLPGLVEAGDLDSSVGPDDPGSAMYTLEDIYNYLNTGVSGTKRTGGFVEPTSPPGSTGHTLDDVHSMISAKCITCTGTLNGTRWCDNGDGTVTDMTTGLVWLKDASWGGLYAFWVNTAVGTNAHDRAAQVKNGTPITLTDGSVEGDWRLPTKNELYYLTHGTEAVLLSTPRDFTGVQSCCYWSSTTYAGNTFNAWNVYMNDGLVTLDGKPSTHYVWPVSGGQ
jgi:hypothetical protein